MLLPRSRSSSLSHCSLQKDAQKARARADPWNVSRLLQGDKAAAKGADKAKKGADAAKNAAAKKQ